MDGSSDFGRIITGKNGKAVPVLLAFSSALLPRPPEWDRDCVHILGPLIKIDRSTALPGAVKRFLAIRPDLPTVLCCFGELFEQWHSASQTNMGTKNDVGEAARHSLLVKCIHAITEAGAKAVVVSPSKTISHIDGLRLPPKEDGRLLLLNKRMSTEAEIQLMTQCNATDSTVTADESNSQNVCNNCLMLCSGDPWTIHAALACVTPVICIDFERDDTPESFWAARVAAAGAGPEPLKATDLKPNILEALIRETIFKGSTGNTAMMYRRKVTEIARAMPDCSIEASPLQSLQESDDESIDGACAKVLQTIINMDENDLAIGSPKVLPSPPGTVEHDSSLAASESVTLPSPFEGSSASSLSVSDIMGSADALALESANDEEDEDDDASGRRGAGFSFSHREAGATTMHQGATHMWGRVDEKFFRLRCGPNYKK